MSQHSPERRAARAKRQRQRDAAPTTRVKVPLSREKLAEAWRMVYKRVEEREENK